MKKIPYSSTRKKFLPRTTTQLHFTTRANKNQLHKNTFTYLRPNNNNNNNNNNNKK